jgi:hypothetical protein
VPTGKLVAVRCIPESDLQADAGGFPPISIR